MVCSLQLASQNYCWLNIGGLASNRIWCVTVFLQPPRPDKDKYKRKREEEKLCSAIIQKTVFVLVDFGLEASNSRPHS